MTEFDKLLMELRLESKRLENRGKPPVISPDVAQTAEFTFSNFSPLGHAGDSGSLLLARYKRDPQKRYVVKHAYTDCACNEYVYTKLAQAMAYTMPEAVLFRLSPAEKRGCFKTEYIIGIRYLDVEIESPSYAQIRKMAVNWREYFSFRGMYAIFGEEDGLETPLAKDGRIYRIDTTDAFPLNNYQLDMAGITRDLGAGNPHDFLKKQLLSSDFSNVLPKSRCDSILKACLEKDESCVSYYLEPFSRIQEIRNDYIDDFLNTLCYFYPDMIGEYLKRYISALKAQCADYLKEKR